MISRRGQVTIFVIVAVLVVAMVAVFFLVRSGIVKNPFNTGGEINPVSYMQDCLADTLEQNVAKISIQGGYMQNPLNISFQFSDEDEPTDISYLCYTQLNYLQCINQEPALIQHLKKEVKDSINDKVKMCFEQMVEGLKKNSEVKSEYNDFNVELSSGKIKLNIDDKLTITKGDETFTQNNLEVPFRNNLYDNAIVAHEIANQEAEFCNFESQGYMLIYPEFKIDKFMTGNSIKIYTVEYKRTKERFRFAIRSCAIPPGL